MGIITRAVGFKTRDLTAHLVHSGQKCLKGTGAPNLGTADDLNGFGAGFGAPGIPKNCWRQQLLWEPLDLPAQIRCWKINTGVYNRIFSPTVGSARIFDFFCWKPFCSSSEKYRDCFSVHNSSRMANFLHISVGNLRSKHYMTNNFTQNI